MIRKMELTDIPVLLILGEKMFDESQFKQYGTYDPEKIIPYLETACSHPDGYGYVAEEEEKIVGYIFGIAMPQFLTGHLQSHEFALYVAKEKRGSMYGVLLIKEYIKWATEKGVREILIDNSALIDNEAVGRLFEKVGFTKIGGIYHIVPER